MPEINVHLFSEDAAHEGFLANLTKRIAREEQGSAAIHVVSSRGGHGRALEEFRLYQRAVRGGLVERPQLMVVAIDANCKAWNAARTEIRQCFELPEPPFLSVACPDPHIEKWYMADPDSFRRIVGSAPPRERAKCERSRYKNLLRQAIKSGGYPATLGGVEFANELVWGMDLYRAGRNEPSLRSFVNECRDQIRQILQGRR